MKSQAHGEPSPETAPDIAAGHETSDFAPRPVAWFGVGMIATLLITFAFVWPLLKHFSVSAERAALDDRRRTEPAAASFVQAAPQAGENGAPLLQIVPEEELATMRDRDAEELKTYGWIDARNRVVRLPIERAMDLVAQRGLPATGPATRTMLEMQREPHPVEDQPRPKQ
ncbi:MAG: hypothetical protein JO295_11685 [Verrucomicrobia bacterium]|nr:hypothetical protein [Verrucomicrobiota bacterium]